ncbi:MAG TPA: zinc-binding dehydrogenase [Candidatus Dormibacteraeota bacterium]|jgi:NADPH:quinone reductase-like Zn-dependent oxidoreductase|nr:zinc-binding dehydrogenase [Candidatus Dormibacteraeota bacterium]
MLAAYAARTGGDDPLANLEVGERPQPEPPPGWALLRVHAASLNHHDLFTLRGRSSRPVEPPQVLGCDAAGTVAAYGPDRPDDAPPEGARVVAHSVIGCQNCAACRDTDPLFCRDMSMLSEGEYQGSLAEYVPVPAANLIPLPDAIDFATAATLPTAYLTVYRMLFSRAQLRPGDTVLVHGATGGVATAAILLARAAGIDVISTSRDQAKREIAIQLGARAALGTDREASKQVQTLTGGRGVDAVIETVGEPTWEFSLRAVRIDGTIVVAGATAGFNPPAQLHRIFWRHTRILGSTMGTRPELEKLVAMTASGTLQPLIGATFPLSRAREAFAQLAAGEQRGKLVVLPGS